MFIYWQLKLKSSKGAQIVVIFTKLVINYKKQ